MEKRTLLLIKEDLVRCQVSIQLNSTKQQMTQSWQQEVNESSIDETNENENGSNQNNVEGKVRLDWLIKLKARKREREREWIKE